MKIHLLKATVYKAFVKEHARTSKTGKTTIVKEHSTKKIKNIKDTNNIIDKIKSYAKKKGYSIMDIATNKNFRKKVLTEMKKQKLL